MCTDKDLPTAVEEFNDDRQQVYGEPCQEYQSIYMCFMILDNTFFTVLERDNYLIAQTNDKLWSPHSLMYKSNKF